MKQISLIVGFLILSIFVSAQVVNPPNLICASKKQNGDVTLTWELPSNTCGTFVSYRIYSSNDPEGPFTLLDSVTNQGNTEFTHTGADCNTETKYYYMTTYRQCSGGTTITSDTLNCEDPVPPEINYVTVFNGGVEIFWQPSSSPEAAGYIIYRDDGGFNPIDTVYGRLNNFYFDATADPLNNIEIYTIATLDACENVGPFYNDPHQTILLTTSGSQCSPTLDLNWTPYNNWPDDTTGDHVVEYAINGSAYQTDTTLPATRFGYVFTNFQDGDELCVRIGTHHPTDTFVSYSNAYCETVDIVQPAEFLHITNATVENNEQIRVTWEPDQNADLISINVQRSNDGNAYSVINSQNTGAVLPQEMTYIDTDPRSLDNSKFYRIESVDSCDNSKLSGIAHTIYLQGKAKPNFVNTIEWNPFEITNGVIEQYYIYRNVNGTWELLQTMPPGSGQKMRLDDEISDLHDHQGEFCYRIEAEGYIDFPSGDTSQFLTRSNDMCLQQITRVYAPTAMIIGGKNNEFKPVLSFENPDSYQMRIFNRWGQLIFQTSDINEGWNGTYEGQVVQQGVYTYLITVTGINGNVLNEKGTFMVIR